LNSRNLSQTRRVSGISATQCDKPRIAIDFIELSGVLRVHKEPRGNKNHTHVSRKNLQVPVKQKGGQPEFTRARARRGKRHVPKHQASRAASLALLRYRRSTRAVRFALLRQASSERESGKRGGTKKGETGERKAASKRAARQAGAAEHTAQVGDSPIAR
jgi:hypothetical protein